MGQFVRAWLYAALIIAAPLVGSQSAPVHAASLTVIVTDTTDTIHNPGCATTGTGTCSLRDAILYANTKTSSDTTTITVPTGTYTLAISGRDEDVGLTGDLDIHANVTINGAGSDGTFIQASATGSATGIDRVFHIFTGQTTISGVTVRYGNSQLPNNGFDPGWRPGGGIFLGGSASLTLVSSVISDNVTTTQPCLPSQSMFCITPISGGGIVSFASGQITIVNSTIARNESTTGAGIAMATGSPLTIIGSAITGNTATPLPNGLNMASGGGIAAGQSTVIINSTFSGNAAAGPGAAISASASLTNVTVANNMGTTALNGPITLANSIISATSGGINCMNVASAGHNLDSGSSCGLNQSGDQSNIDPKLGPLANNGGPTLTHALLAGSPAIDTGDNTVCATAPPNGPGAVDQRGVVRPQGAACDIGAFEYQPPSALPSSRPGQVLGATAPSNPSVRTTNAPLLVLIPGIVAPNNLSQCDTAQHWSESIFGTASQPETIYHALVAAGYTGTRYDFNWRRDDAGTRSSHPCFNVAAYGAQDTYEDITDAARMLNQQIQNQMAVLPVTPDRVDIISHSFGGAVALTYIHLYHPQIPTRVIVLDSPVRGCLMANSACHLGTLLPLAFLDSTAFQQMQQADFVHGLEDGFSPMTGNSRAYAVATNGDLAIDYASQWPLADDDPSSPNYWPAGMHPDPSNPQDSYERDGSGNTRVLGASYCVGDPFCHSSVLHNSLAMQWIGQILIYHPAPIPSVRSGGTTSGQAAAVQPAISAPTGGVARTSTPNSTPIPQPPHR